jgi:gas vesicle protein
MSSTVDTLKKDMSEIGSAAENLMGATKGGVLDAATKVAHIYHLVRSIGVDDMLSKVGLARERSALGSTARFASGFAIGVGAGLMFAPSSGKTLRTKLAGSISKAFAPTVEKVEHAVHKVEEVVEHLGHSAAASRKSDDVGTAIHKATTTDNSNLPKNHSA